MSELKKTKLFDFPGYNTTKILFVGRFQSTPVIAYPVLNEGLPIKMT